VNTRSTRPSFPFRRIVVWGLKSASYDAYHYIHRGFARAARKMGIPGFWVDDDARYRDLVRPGDLVISVDIAGSQLPLVSGARYVLHNFPDDVLQRLRPEEYIRLQVYTKGVERGAEKIAGATWFDAGTRTLYQPWGTPLLRDEFLPPTAYRLRSTAFWVGSVWDNEEHQGNVKEYGLLWAALRSHGIRLIQARVPEWLHATTIARSAVAPGIGGRWQVEQGHMTCRTVKNVSFGQVAATNIGEFRQIFGDAFVHSEDIEELVDRLVGLRERERQELVRVEQELIAPHTYDWKLLHMAERF